MLQPHFALPLPFLPLGPIRFPIALGHHLIPSPANWAASMGSALCQGTTSQRLPLLMYYAVTHKKGASVSGPRLRWPV